jgi:hypothetical protein
VLSYICYLLLLFINVEQFIPPPSKIIPITVSKLIATIYLMVLLIYLIFVQTPISLMDWILPDKIYIPKRLRRKSKWKQAIVMLSYVAICLCTPVANGLSQHITIIPSKVKHKHRNKTWITPNRKQNEGEVRATSTYQYRFITKKRQGTQEPPRHHENESHVFSINNHETSSKGSVSIR